MDRAAAFEAEGRGFESLQARHANFRLSSQRKACPEHAERQRSTSPQEKVDSRFRGNDSDGVSFEAGEGRVSTGEVQGGSFASSTVALRRTAYMVWRGHIYLRASADSQPTATTLPGR